MWIQPGFGADFASNVTVVYSVGQKGLLGFEMSLHSAANSLACPHPANWPITEDSSSILETRNKPFSPTL